MRSDHGLVVRIAGAMHTALWGLHANRRTHLWGLERGRDEGAMSVRHKEIRAPKEDIADPLRRHILPEAERHDVGETPKLGKAELAQRQQVPDF